MWNSAHRENFARSESVTAPRRSKSAAATGSFTLAPRIAGRKCGEPVAFKTPKIERLRFQRGVAGFLRWSEGDFLSADWYLAARAIFRHRGKAAYLSQRSVTVFIVVQWSSRRSHQNSIRLNQSNIFYV